MSFTSILTIIATFSMIPLIHSSVTEVTCQRSGISSLVNADNFLVYYVFADNTLEKPLKEELIRQLQVLGTVYTGDDSTLSQKQKDAKYRIGQPILEVIISPIIEESPSSTTYKKLPVIELSVKMRTGVKLINNDHQIAGVVWENHRFIGKMNNKKEFIQKAVKNLNAILENFKTDYQIANPSNEQKHPQFFFYS